MNLVPTIYGWLMDLAPVDSYDLSSLRSLTYAGSPFAVEMLKRAITVFGPIFAQGYGATETAGGPITMLEAADHHLDGVESRLLAGAGKRRSARKSRSSTTTTRPSGPVSSAKSAPAASTS